jgi:Fe-S cluster assembly protein SufD
MATLATLTESDVIALSERLGEPAWLLERRLEAYKAFADLPWPDRRVEEWRYTDPARFDLTRPVLEPPAAAPPAAASAPRAEGVVAAVRDRVAAHVALTGAAATATVTPAAAAAGVVATSLSAAAHDHEAAVRDALGAAVGAERKFDAANLAAFTAGAFVHVPADVELADPIAVTVAVTAEGTALPRVLVVLGAHARAQVYVDHHGDAAATVVEVVEAVLGEGARLDIVTAQDWGPRVDHVGAHRGWVGANAAHHHLEVTTGGRTVYLTPDVRLAQPGAAGELLGVYLTGAGQQVEHRSLIHHDASATTSDTVYKGALSGDGVASWYGNIRIEPHARATASDETNRNLILSDDARANSIPFLEILCSDVVRCGHHSSVGQLDRLQEFYLTSRGIPPAEARRLLVLGFFAEVVERVDLPGVKDAVLAEVAARIGA